MNWRWLYGELQNIQNIFESLTKSDELSKTNFLTGIPEDDKINFLKVTEILKEYLKPRMSKNKPKMAYRWYPYQAIANLLAIPLLETTRIMGQTFAHSIAL